MTEERDPPAARGEARTDGASGEAAGEEEPEGRRLFERTVPEVIRRLIERALETGVEKLSEGPENLRHFLGELRLPKEALNYIYGQIDDTKKGLYRVVAKEIRDVLEHTNFAAEVADLLTKLSFEITTQIRFVRSPAAPDDRAPGEGQAQEAPAPEPEGGGALPRPRVVSKLTVKGGEKPDRRSRE